MTRRPSNRTQTAPAKSPLDSERPLSFLKLDEAQRAAFDRLAGDDEARRFEFAVALQVLADSSGFDPDTGTDPGFSLSDLRRLETDTRSIATRMERVRASKFGVIFLVRGNPFHALPDWLTGYADFLRSQGESFKRNRRPFARYRKALFLALVKLRTGRWRDAEVAKILGETPEGLRVWRNRKVNRSAIQLLIQLRD